VEYFYVLRTLSPRTRLEEIKAAEQVVWRASEIFVTRSGRYRLPHKLQGKTVCTNIRQLQLYAILPRLGQQADYICLYQKTYGVPQPVSDGPANNKTFRL
jgi:hypothetical protein